jgi:DNA-binding transcriptional ArsR family regulator
MRSTPRLDLLFHAVAHPARRRMVERLASRDHTVSELAELFEFSQPAVTKHLDVLEAAGLVTRRREGRLRYCRLRPEALDATVAWVERTRALWERRLDALEQLMHDTPD